MVSWEMIHHTEMDLVGFWEINLKEEWSKLTCSLLAERYRIEPVQEKSSHDNVRLPGGSQVS